MVVVRVLGRKKRDPVGFECRVAGHDGEALDPCLRDEEAVEGVSG